jgi:hypothetical protein
MQKNAKVNGVDIEKIQTQLQKDYHSILQDSKVRTHTFMIENCDYAPNASG